MSIESTRSNLKQKMKPIHSQQRKGAGDGAHLSGSLPAQGQLHSSSPRSPRKNPPKPLKQSSTISKASASPRSTEKSSKGPHKSKSSTEELVFEDFSEEAYFSPLPPQEQLDTSSPTLPRKGWLDLSTPSTSISKGSPSSRSTGTSPRGKHTSNGSPLSSKTTTPFSLSKVDPPPLATAKNDTPKGSASSSSSSRSKEISPRRRLSDGSLLSNTPKNTVKQRYISASVELEPAPLVPARSPQQDPRKSKKIIHDANNGKAKGSISSSSSSSSPRSKTKSPRKISDSSPLANSPTTVQQQYISASSTLEPAPLVPTRSSRSNNDSEAGAAGGTASASAAVQMMREYDSRNLAQGGVNNMMDDSDRDLLSPKLSSRALRNSPSSPRRISDPRNRVTRRSSSHDDDSEDLVAAKMPRSRTASFNDARTMDPPAPHVKEALSKSKKHAVATVDASILNNTEAEAGRLSLSPAHTPATPITGGGDVQVCLPVASPTEPSSFAQSGEPSTAAELSQTYILPVGKDTVSSYNALQSSMAPITEDAPTRTVEASVLSFCTVSSVGASNSSDVVEASPLDPRFGSNQVPKQNHFDKGFSSGFQQQLDRQRIEKQKLQLEQDSARRVQEHKSKEKTVPPAPSDQVSKIKEVGESISGLETVQHRNASSRNFEKQKMSSVREDARSSVQLDPLRNALPARPETNSCCNIL